MNYGQFLQMLPEAELIIALIATFFVDFFVKNDDPKKVVKVSAPAIAFLIYLTVAMLFPETKDLFGGLYVQTPAVGVMKSILAFGTLIVCRRDEVYPRLRYPDRLHHGKAVGGKDQASGR